MTDQDSKGNRSIAVCGPGQSEPARVRYRASATWRSAANASVVARRDLGDRVILVAIDAGGRFRIDVSRTVEEWSQPDSIAGIAVRVVESVCRSLTVTGQISSQEEAGRLVAALTSLDLALTRSGPTLPESLNQDRKPQN